MSETKELLRRGLGEFEPMPDAFDRVLARRGRKRLNRRVAAGVLGIALFALVMAGIGLIRASVPTTIPADEGEPTVTVETTGTWTGPCADSQDGPPPRVCLGPLEEGTYTSRRFEPALTFTVPAGWNNPWDTRGAFALWTPGWLDGADDPGDPGIYLFDHPGLSLFRDVRPDEGCSDGVDAAAGTSAIELGTWVSDHPGIATRGPSPVEIGGLSCHQLDVSIRETWKSCRIENGTGPVSVPLFDQFGLIEHPGYATMRLILLDLPDGGNVLIAIDGDQVDHAMPVIRSFVFDVG